MREACFFENVSRLLQVAQARCQVSELICTLAEMILVSIDSRSNEAAKRQSFFLN